MPTVLSHRTRATLAAVLLSSLPAAALAQNAAPASPEPLTGAVNGAAASATPRYLDDRSTPERLIRSLYNAIALQQYARAWNYYGPQKPVESYKAFAQGYAGTTGVRLAFGKVTEEGAAGSTYATIPVAIAAQSADGVQVFGGCYLTRLEEPQIAAPDFTPMFIVKGHLEKRGHGDSADLSSAVPRSCSPEAEPAF
ncbi:hypothetical protein [Acidimangrovimonas sediminis]|uniref:hypothetical protein n=1 Tax=Acidimangrovimonas sediminis TaxID=2056283 RepID=UPI000C80039A|nr:hypothetical protein [Acidimangrovimonas sediminis]